MIINPNKNVKEALQEATSFLRGRDIDAARTEAELLLACLLEVDRPYLYAHGEVELPYATLERFRQLCRRRGNGEPFAYIKGEKEFMGRQFYVDRGVFIPRPETEILVEEVLQWVHQYANKAGEEKGLNILDLGTGSGCIAVSLACYLPRARLVAVDSDRSALAAARRNSLRHGAGPRITFRQGNYFEALRGQEDVDHYFAVIVSNPPYIEEGALSGLPVEVQKEPRNALCGGPDGLTAYREIFAGAREFLLSPGLLALELGAGQAATAAAMAVQAGFTVPMPIKDYAGMERVLLCLNTIPDTCRWK